MNLKIRKIYHNEADRIGVIFPFDFETKEFSDIRIIQQLPGQKDLRTTMIYTPGAKGVKDNLLSPLDRLMVKKSRYENKKICKNYVNLRKLRS